MFSDRDLKALFELVSGSVDISGYDVSRLHYLGRLLIYALRDNLITVSLTEEGVYARAALQERLERVKEDRRRVTKAVRRFRESEEPLCIRELDMPPGWYEFYDNSGAAVRVSPFGDMAFVCNGEEVTIAQKNRKRVLCRAVLRRARAALLAHLGHATFEMVYERIKRYGSG